MTLLLRILYFFRALPIPIIKTQLQRLQSKMIEFIWGQKGHQLSKTTIFRAKNKDGLGVPILLWYYQAAQLTQLSTIYSCTAHPDWIYMERQTTPNHTHDYLMWCPVKAQPPMLAPTLSHSFTLWDSLRIWNHSQIVSPIRPPSHIFHNPLFPPGLDIRAFKCWLDKGLYRIGHYFLPTGL